ncbi:acyltransferase domain-containing protein [Actinopolymorpha sp. B17G11]|uniref:acyltransferase domain-containing protein n=1 Tax=Actinopolymorpha sp. B17G11 TaxID=3160861 RepID=UPI0032E45207
MAPPGCSSSIRSGPGRNCRASTTCFAEVLVNLGAPQPVGGFRGWPAVPDGSGAVGRHLYVWLYLTMTPHVRRYHAARGIPDVISWTTLGELGAEMTSTRSMYGASGLQWQWALPLVFRGAFYRLGRLAFDRATISFTDPPLQPGASAIYTHIPEGGRLSPADCDESFARARTFFPRHFDDNPVAFLCSSWLMDDQLAAYLPEESNLIRFQRRFRLLPNPGDTSDKTILDFVFHRLHDERDIQPSVLDTLPQDTTLQRAYVTRLRAGHHWRSRTGWFPLHNRPAAPAEFAGIR